MKDVYHTSLLCSLTNTFSLDGEEKEPHALKSVRPHTLYGCL
jgi:hypothetical protein